MRHRNGEQFRQPTALVLRALGLGDLVTAVPALRGIRRALPGHRLVLATSPALAPLVGEMEFVDAIVENEGLAPLPVQLEGDDLAVNLHGRGPESTLALLDAGTPELVAFAHPDIPATFGFPRWKRGEHEVRRWCRLLWENHIDARMDDIYLDPPSIDVGHREGITVLHPGASAPARLWPPDRWAVVARVLASEGERIVITGNRAEIPLAREIARQAGLSPESVLAGRTSVAELAALVARAARVISSDTGPAHLATAYGTPSLTLFGPTAPGEWGPPPGHLHKVIWKGKRGPANANAPAPGLLAIGVEEVLVAVEGLPLRQAPATRAATPRSETS